MKVNTPLGTTSVIITGLLPGQSVAVGLINAVGTGPTAEYTVPGAVAPDAPVIED